MIILISEEHKFRKRGDIPNGSMTRLGLALICMLCGALCYDTVKEQNLMYAKMFSALLCDALVEDVYR